MIKNVFIILIASGLLSSCIKTAEQVQREKRFESISEQMSDSQSLLAGLVTQMKDMQAQIDRMNGKLEELEYSKISPDEIKKNRETIALIQTQQETQLNQLSQIQSELKEQRSFIEKVTEKLGSNIKTERPAQKKNAKSELAQALELVTNDKFQEARSALQELVDNPGLTPGDQNKLLHGLGRVEYYTKNYDQALVYFSKIFSKYPQASLAPSCLLFIGRTLNKLGKKDEALEAFKKVIEDYAGSKEAKEAKKEL